MKILVGFLSLFIVAATSFADNHTSNDVRLYFRTSSIHQRPGSLTTDISVHGDGKVIAVTTRFGMMTPVIPVLIKTLSSEELATIEDQIKLAYEGGIAPPQPVHCMAMSINNVYYTADNGKLLLESGAVPCGNMTRNDSQAATELVDLLNDLNREYNAANSQR